MLGKNWTTTLPGLAAICTALGNILTGLSTDPSMIDWAMNLATLMTGIGLIFAKSHNVTGGSIVQATPVAASLEKMDEQQAQGLVAAGVVLAAKHVKADIVKAEKAEHKAELDANKAAEKGKDS